ncbi:MAG: thioredoxin-dependent thiol peroxidase [Deltaproteobacteria bacterium]|nr:thioredoxin-dependent thiol peroxidase [Deltaproteobacteria bacterium]
MPGLEAGQKAPAFKLPSAQGGVRGEVSLADFKGKQVVIYFYPRDSTPGCTVEARDFRDAAKQLAKKGAVVLGISKDSIESHCKFADKEQLNFALLSDPDGKVIAAYGAWGEKNMYGKKMMGIIRSTVIVGVDGKVKQVFPKVKVAGHVEAVLAAL